MIQGIAAIDSEVRDKNSVRDYGSEFKKLEHRRDSDPMKLYSYVLKKLDDYFSIRGLTYLPGQRDLLAKAAETILQAVSGTVTAIPFRDASVSLDEARRPSSPGQTSRVPEKPGQSRMLSGDC